MTDLQHLIERLDEAMDRFGCRVSGHRWIKRWDTVERRMRPSRCARCGVTAGDRP